MDAFTIGSWPVDSRVTLTRVAWDQQYRDVVRFADEAERTSYFESLESDSINIEKMTYLRFGEPIRINIPFNACYNYNYLIVENPKLPVPGETEPPKLFYFITGVAMVAPNTSALTLQLDVFQTYLFDFELGYCFLDRGHWPMAEFQKKVGYDKYNYPILDWSAMRNLLTVPEGLDLGNEYLIINHDYHDLSWGSQLKSSTLGRTPIGNWAIIVMSTTDLESDWGNENNPSLKTAQGGEYDGLLGGCSCYIFNSAYIKPLMEDLSKAPWVASGIISITVVPNIFFQSSFGSENDTMSFENVPINGGKTTYSAWKMPKFTDDEYLGILSTYDDIPTLIRNGLTRSTRNLYRHFAKLFTFPYLFFEINNMNGTSLLLKPELMNSDTFDFKILSCAIPGNIRMCFYPYRYGAGANSSIRNDEYITLVARDTPTEKSMYTVDGGFNLDCAIWFDNFPQLSFVNDNYLMYLAGTTHSRHYQYQAAGWQQAKTNMSVEAGREAMYTGMNTQLANQRITNIAGAATTGLNLLGSTIGGAASGGLAGAGAGLLGGAFSAAGTGVGLYAQNLQLENSLKSQGDIYDINAQLAQNIAQGDYENAIASINATVQDAALTQPSIVGAAGGNGFNMANGMMGFDIRIKAPDEKHLKMLCNFWGRYGYAFHEFMKPPKNLACMKYFTYWKFKDTYITCAKSDEGAKDVLRGIFERGVTVWNKPDDIGNVDPLDNWEVA